MSLTAAQILKLYPNASKSLLEANAAPKPLTAKQNDSTGLVGARKGILEFALPVEPKPVQGGKKIGFNSSTGRRIIYTDKAASQYYKDIETASRPFSPNSPHEGPLHVIYAFFITRPKKLHRKSDPDHPIWCPYFRDLDNLIKGTQDALTNAGFWKSDSQIVRMEAMKFYTAKGGSGMIKVTISSIVEP